MADLQIILQEKSFGGFQRIYSHTSEVNQSEMRFALFLPPQATATNKVPVIYFMPGLEMNHKTFINKCDSQRYASEQGVVLVAPDTAPHNSGIPGEKDRPEYGFKAGHYINATQEPWSKHYRMHTYITTELRKIVTENFPVLADKQSIMGHSIGGYGALQLSIKNPGLYVSTSALAPVCDPTQAPLSQVAFTVYFGPDRSKWDEWNILKLVKKLKGTSLKFKIDQGSHDVYLNDLHTQDFLDACEEAKIPVDYNLRDGYDHHYFFVKTFIEEHIKYHMEHLKRA